MELLLAFAVCVEAFRYFPNYFLVDVAAPRKREWVEAAGFNVNGIVSEAQVAAVC